MCEAVGCEYESCWVRCVEEWDFDSESVSVFCEKADYEYGCCRLVG